jgi:hypothetical protein
MYHYCAMAQLRYADFEACLMEDAEEFMPGDFFTIIFCHNPIHRLEGTQTL